MADQDNPELYDRLADALIAFCRERQKILPAEFDQLLFAHGLIEDIPSPGTRERAILVRVRSDTRHKLRPILRSRGVDFAQIGWLTTGEGAIYTIRDMMVSAFTGITKAPDDTTRLVEQRWSFIGRGLASQASMIAQRLNVNEEMRQLLLDTAAEESQALKERMIRVIYTTMVGNGIQWPEELRSMLAPRQRAAELKRIKPKRRRRIA